jgi:protein tyrosine phosphatase (PTP) superfamily phosphohydrolase (DUF442 family)
MSRVKTQNTDHSYFRAAERCGWGKKKAREMMKLASRYGMAYAHLAAGPVRDFLERKQIGNPHKRIKLYQDFIFVFCSTSTKCITVYPLPEELKEIAN